MVTHRNRNKKSAFIT